MPTVKMTEVYDLKTTRDKIGILGIHTPDAITISKRWMGLFMNYKKFRVRSCNIRLACASLLPADPLQVGVEGPNAVAPQDLMNPILYRAMSNDVWNWFMGRLYSAFSGNRSIKFLDAFPGGTAGGAENVYYAMLGESGWRKAMPQAGLQMKNLVPLVHQVVDTFGNMDIGFGNQGSELDNHPYVNASGTLGTDNTVPQVLKGRAMPYPSIACTDPNTGSDAANPSFVPQSINKTFVACLVLPPGKLTEFYFRLVVDWYIDFFELTSIVDKLNYQQVAGVGSLVYARNYSFESAKSASEVDESATNTNTVDTIGTDINLIMES